MKLTESQLENIVESLSETIVNLRNELQFVIKDRDEYKSLFMFLSEENSKLKQTLKEIEESKWQNTIYRDNMMCLK